MNGVEADQVREGRSSGFLVATELTAVDGQGILGNTLGTGINLGIPLTSIYSRENVVPQAEKAPLLLFFSRNGHIELNRMKNLPLNK